MLQAIAQRPPSRPNCIANPRDRPHTQNVGREKPNNSTDPEFARGGTSEGMCYAQFSFEERPGRFLGEIKMPLAKEQISRRIPVHTLQVRLSPEVFEQMQDEAKNGKKPIEAVLAESAAQGAFSWAQARHPGKFPNSLADRWERACRDLNK